MHTFFFHGQLPIGMRDGAALYGQLDEDESHHCRKVLRLEVGERIGLLDGQGTLGIALIHELGRQVTVKIISVKHFDEIAPAIDVAAALPKGPRADFLIEQCSQLSARALIPLRTQRSVTDPRETKIEKFHRAAVESAKQCERPYVMKVEGVADFEAVVAREYDLKLMAHPRQEGAVSPDLGGGVKNCLLLIGPEGGWTDEELEIAQRHGAKLWQFAPHVLRVETAAAAGLAVLRAGLVVGR
jgi:16S rRNA (uracil1498-N3)-methyltransferase